MSDYTPPVAERANVVTYASREEWLAHRHDGIGASEAAAILGVNPYCSPFALWSEKLGLVEPRAMSDAMTWGLKLEPLVAEHYAQETGRQVFAPAPWTVHVSGTRPWMRATLDRLVRCETQPGVHGVLELKTTNARLADQWDEEPPLPYVIQVQHQLAVTGYLWGSLAVLIGGQTFRWVDIPRNDEFIALLIAREAEFWRRLVERDPPDVDGSDSAREALAKLYPRERPDVDPVALPPEADEWDAVRQQAIEEIAAAERRKADAEARIKALIGEAPAGLLPGGVRYTWKLQAKKGYVVEPSSVRVLRRLSAKREAA